MSDIANILAGEAASILEHPCTAIPKSVIHALIRTASLRHQEI